jgi:hypothetical protein
MAKKEMKDIDIEISDKVEPISADIPAEKFMKVLEAIDWKLWEMLQIMQEWDKEDKED